jgi:hypothetical protein
MADVTETVFETAGPRTIPSRELTPVELRCPEVCSPALEERDGGIGFAVDGWYEVLMEVGWDRSREGTRFSHTKIPGRQPLHSEAIDAGVLVDVSGGRQLLRGNARFGPDGHARILLEVWHDGDEPREVRHASLSVRELCVPWTLDAERMTAARGG